MIKYDGRNSVEIRHEQDEKRAEERERALDAEAAAMTCPDCGEYGTIYYEDGSYICPCGWTKAVA